MKKNIVTIGILSLFLGSSFAFFFYEKYKVSESSLGKELLLIHETWLRPTVMFHASVNKNIDVFEPRSISTRSKQEGDVIFASADISYASRFMTIKRWTDNVCKKGSFDHGPYYMIIKNKDLFLEEDKGGAIYVLPAENFCYDLAFKKVTRKEWLKTGKHKGYGSLSEWVSKEAVKPLYKIEFKSTFDAMIDLGVQVYFVDDDKFKEINSLWGKSDNTELRKYLMELPSENQKMKKNAIPLFDYTKFN